MSVVGYCKLKHLCTKEINWESESELLILTYKEFTSCNSEDEITDVNSFLAKLEEGSLLGIDRLDVLKDLLKEMSKWGLLEMVNEFEKKRKDFKQFLEKIRRSLNESNELQRLILICQRQNLIAREREEHIPNISALFTELEKKNYLGIGNLSILRTMATEVEKPDLYRLVDDFDEKTKQEDDADIKRKKWEDCKLGARAQAASVLVGGINIGKSLFGVLTLHCTFTNFIRGVGVGTIWRILSETNSLEEFANAFKEVVLPFGNWLLAISEGSIRFTLQAENISALEALWQSYQDETLQKNMQKFLVTEEIKLQAGGEVTLTVHIDEEEYRNAMWDFIRSETEVLERRGGEQRGLKDRASSESDLSRMRGLVSEDGKYVQVNEFMSIEKKTQVEEFLENRQETHSTITRTSDSGVGSWSRASTEWGSEEGAGGSRKEKFDHVEEWITEAIENLDNALSELKTTTQSEVVLRVSVKQAKQELEKSREKIHNWKESGNEIPFTGNQMALVFGEAEEYFFSPELSAEGIVKKVENILQMNQDMFKQPNEDFAKLIRLVAKTAKRLNRIDVFDHLRRYAPAGTTGLSWVTTFL